MQIARIPPVDPAPAPITAVLVMHAGHIYSSFDFLFELSMCWMPQSLFSPSRPLVWVPRWPTPRPAPAIRTVFSCDIHNRAPVSRSVLLSAITPLERM